MNTHSIIFSIHPQTFDQFEYDGCDNCEEFLRMKNNKDNVYDHTSNNFDGIIALMSPEDSWVAKWQRIGKDTNLSLNKQPMNYFPSFRPFHKRDLCNLRFWKPAHWHHPRNEKPRNTL